MTTTNAAPVSNLARGILEEIVAPTATKGGHIVFHVPTSSYRLHLRAAGVIKASVGKRLVGIITCEARRVDVVLQGGRLVEPVIGRPRRIHGTVLQTGSGTLTVNCAGGAAVDSAPMPVVVKLTDPRDQIATYEVGTLVAFDVLEGATFEER